MLHLPSFILVCVCCCFATGTWQWGNQLLYGYNEGMDSELQEVFNYAVGKGINLFDTADSYVEWLSWHVLAILQEISLQKCGHLSSVRMAHDPPHALCRYGTPERAQ